MPRIPLVLALKALVAEYGDEEPTETRPDAPPPGFVYVRPTGPQGAGKSRLWPDIGEGEGPWSYAERMADTKNETTGFAYYPRGRFALIGSVQAQHGGTIPETLDRMTHPYDWMSQAELDNAAKLAERDRNSGVSPR